jgi:L-ascorbate metabolism protein UlaG (beta-lactamase superfamily)
VGEVTWVGHSTVLLELGRTRLITDPVLTARVAHLRRYDRVELEGPDRLEAALISHVHLDHLHVPSLRRLPPDTTVIVPRGAGRLLRHRGFTDVRETSIGETMSIGGVDIVTVPARHSDRRGPHSRVAAPAVGYVVRWAGRAVYFAGDTDLFPRMADLAPVDVALLPIWGWGPTLGDGHLDPRRAAAATELLDARLVVPIHWGTFSPSPLRRRPPAWLSEPVERFRDELDRLGLVDRLRPLAPGGRLALLDDPPTSSAAASPQEPAR